MQKNQNADKNLDIALFNDGDKLLQSLQQGAVYDVIFLDVLMPCLNGIDTAREIRKLNSSCAIVFLTNSPEFALDSYSVDALSYLLKPVDAARVWDIIEKAICNKEAEAKKSILVKTGGVIQKIFFYNILYIEVINNRLLYHLDNETIVTAIGKMNDLEQSLRDYPQFAKPHRSFLVNIDHVEKLAPSQIYMHGGDEIPLSRNCCAAFRDQYFMYYLNQKKGAFI